MWSVDTLPQIVRMTDLQLLSSVLGYHVELPPDSLARLCGVLPHNQVRETSPFDEKPERPAEYVLACAKELICRALIQASSNERQTLEGAEKLKRFLQLRLAGKPVEVFCVLFLDCKNGVIAFEEMFPGTLCQATVYPREVVKRALYFDASAVILAHNHPSGDARASVADERLTQRLKDAFGLVDIRLLDHVIVAGGRTFSMLENGLL
jgi:DNA repair protein RadC